MELPNDSASASILELRIVVDTSVFVAALISSEGASREVIRRCLQGRETAVMGEKLLCEFEDVLRRPPIMNRCPLNEAEREDLLDAFVAQAEPTDIFYLWRPTLRDEGDNHLVELAIAGDAEAIVTHNAKDFKNSELKFDFEVLTPAEFLGKSD